MRSLSIVRESCKRNLEFLKLAYCAKLKRHRRASKKEAEVNRCATKNDTRMRALTGMMSQESKSEYLESCRPALSESHPRRQKRDDRRGQRHPGLGSQARHQSLQRPSEIWPRGGNRGSKATYTHEVKQIVVESGSAASSRAANCHHSLWLDS